MRGSQYFFCASLPYLISTGPSMFTPKGTMRGACASAHSFSKMNFSTAVQPGPPYCSGQWLASQPRALRMACHSSMSALARILPPRTFSDSRTGSLSARKARTSARKASSSGVKFRSIVRSSIDFEQARRAHAAGNAHRDHRVLRAAALAFDQHVAREARAGHAEGVADGDRATVHVEQFRRNAQLLLAVDRLRGEGFVEFPEADVLDLEAMAREQLGHREHR